MSCAVQRTFFAVGFQYENTIGKDFQVGGWSSFIHEDLPMGKEYPEVRAEV